jgi:hypothetical protein
MKRIENYSPPSAVNLIQLKKDLGYTSQQMADLAGLAQGGHWRKYTGTGNQRDLGQSMHFYMAALLTLTDDELDRVYATMQDHGADFDVGDLPVRAKSHWV